MKDLAEILLVLKFFNHPEFDKQDELEESTSCSMRYFMYLTPLCSRRYHQAAAEDEKILQAEERERLRLYLRSGPSLDNGTFLDEMTHSSSYCYALRLGPGSPR